jgi:hypothetical protein
MPSDINATALVQQAQEALAPVHHVFRAAVESALARGEAWWTEQGACDTDRDARISAELGFFAKGHLDPHRFAALFAHPQALTPEVRKEMKRALEELRDSAAAVDVMIAAVDPGGSLADTISDALAEAGRAFSAVRVIDRVRAHSGSEVPAVTHLPFQSWTRIERRYAPPLVVAVAGSDLHAAALADYADGGLKIVLVVEGACPPAALVRLVTPGTFVMQTTHAASLERLAGFEGPAIAAIMRESAACFTHDPRGGTEPWQRLSIERLPSPPFARVPGMSAWQLTEDLRQLQALAAAPEGRAMPSGAPASGESPLAVDRLAAWLLEQADFTGLA